MSTFAPFIVFGHSSKLSITPSPSESFGAATGVATGAGFSATGAGFETSPNGTDNPNVYNNVLSP
ncbi:hypothetical protein [Aliarcobacter butzleri]|uniref:hypothetical protein n=1 Tax=Aliarcobacter butzleri TaxID=28197 RepID=UPI003AFB4149